MRDVLVKALEDANQAHAVSQRNLSAAFIALKFHDMLQTGFHNKIVRCAIYPHGLLVTDDMSFHDDGKLKRITGTVLRPDGTPTVRLGTVHFPTSMRIETADIPVTARMFYNGEPVFDFTFLTPPGPTFRFLTTQGRTDEFLDGKCTFNGATVNQVATWERLP